MSHLLSDAFVNMLSGVWAYGLLFLLLQAALKAKELLNKHSNKTVLVDLIQTDSISVISMFCDYI